MVAAQYAYNKGRTFTRRILAAFGVFFGLFALLFTATPKIWGSNYMNQNMSFNLFSQNVAHADTPHTPDTAEISSCDSSGGTDCGTGTSDSSCDCSCF